MYQQEECGTRITDSNDFSVIHSAFLERIVDLTIVHSSEIKGPLKKPYYFCSPFMREVLISDHDT
jgi:hypothetical protein